MCRIQHSIKENEELFVYAGLVYFWHIINLVLIGLGSVVEFCVVKGDWNLQCGIGYGKVLLLEVH